MKAYLIRIDKEDKQTLGVLQLFDGTIKVFECKTLELPWLNNAPYVSCIPTGEYEAEKHNSPMHGECFKIKDVANRTQILIHKGNYNRDTLGCILVGTGFSDINNDGIRDLYSSAQALQQLMKAAKNGFKLIIV